MKTAVIMSRVSSDEQALGYSLGIQEDTLTKYCEKNNLRILQKFKEDHSAKDFNRPEFDSFLNYAKKYKGQIDYFLVTSWDRFSRNITDAFMMIRTLKKLGITVQAIEQQIDPSIPENLAMLALFLAIPEIDNERRSIKIKGGMQAALKAGRWCRKAPRGYRNA
jgi:site-specific DNA recombinase